MRRSNDVLEAQAHRAIVELERVDELVKIIPHLLGQIRGLEAEIEKLHKLLDNQREESNRT